MESVRNSRQDVARHLLPDAAIAEGADAITESSDRFASELDALLLSFRPITSLWLCKSIELLPWIAVGYLIWRVLVEPWDPMYISALISLIATSWLILMLFDGVGSVVRNLWLGGFVRAPSLHQRLKWWSMLDPWAGLTEAQNSAERYGLFIRKLQSTMNNWIAGLVVGGFFAALMAAVWPYKLLMEMGAPVDLRTLTITFVQQWANDVDSGSWLTLVKHGGEIASGQLVGMMVWRVGVLAYALYRLGTSFDLRIQSHHPDRCGGLKTVGDLCVLGALIGTIPSFFCAAWIMLAQFGDLRGYALWIPYAQYLALGFALTLLIFFQPVYGLHRAMVRSRASSEPELERIAARINKLVNSVVETAASGAVITNGSDVGAELDRLRKAYELGRVSPSWPIDRHAFQRFVGAQVVPLLGLTTLGPELTRFVVQQLGRL